MLLGLDLGTGSVKALLMDEDGATLGGGSTSYPVRSPRPGWAESSPSDWWSAVVDATRDAVGSRGARQRDRTVQAAIKAVKAGEGAVNPDGTLTAGPAVLLPEEFSSRLVAADPEYTAALPEGSGLVVLDGTVTPELEAEGWAKDRIRELQELRRTTGLDVSDRISLVMAVPAEREAWARTHAEMIAREILATTFEFGEPTDASDIGDGVRVAIAKV